MTPLQIEIIKKFGRKELTEGCIIKNNPFDNDKVIWITRSIVSMGFFKKEVIAVYAKIFGNKDSNEENIPIENIEILGHIPQWNDIFSTLREIGLESFLGSDSLLIDPDEKVGKKVCIEVNKYIPLIKQDESTLSQLLSLFK